VLAVGTCLVVTQVTFPRLLAIFLIELWMTLLVLAALQAASVRAQCDRRKTDSA
jgi:hypothetical protein